MPIKSSLERTTELRIQFPVSSGQHHRKGEEWRPVSPPSTKKEEKIVPVVIPTPVAVVNPVTVPAVLQTNIQAVKPTNAPIVMPTPVPTSSIPLPPDPTPILKPLTNFNVPGTTIPQPELGISATSNNNLPAQNFGMALNVSMRKS